MSNSRTPLGTIVGGFLLVIMDFRINEIDLLPDVIGWPLMAWAASRLSGRSGWFAAVTAAGVVGFVVAATLLALDPGPVRHAADVARSAAEVVVVFGPCSGIRALSVSPATRRTAAIIRWLDLGLTVLACAVAVAVTGTLAGMAETGQVGTGEGVALAGGGVLVLLVVAMLVVLAWFLVFTWGARREPELAASGGSGRSRRTRGVSSS